MDNSAPLTPSGDGPNDNMDAVRDLLFGRQHPGFVGRVASPNQSVFEIDESDDEEEVVDTIELRLSSIENLLRKEADTRIKKDEALRKLVEQKEDSISERVATLEGRIEHVETRLKGEIEKQAEQRAEEMASMKAEILELVEERFDALSGKAVERMEMGDLLIDLGLKIQPATEIKE